MATDDKTLKDIIKDPEKASDLENTTEIVGNIKNEDDFQDAIIEAQSKTKNKSHIDIFKDIDTTIHTHLANQDSESMLTFITKSALALGSSDIHYDQ